MKATWYTVEGENAIALIPETLDELRGLLAIYGGDVICPDCESPIDPGVDTCPHCGEGISCDASHYEISYDKRRSD